MPFLPLREDLAVRRVEDVESSPVVGGDQLTVDEQLAHVEGSVVASGHVFEFLAVQIQGEEDTRGVYQRHQADEAGGCWAPRACRVRGLRCMLGQEGETHEAPSRWLSQIMREPFVLAAKGEPNQRQVRSGGAPPLPAAGRAVASRPHSSPSHSL